MEKISIIIPIYNSENYLKQCIESIVNQSYKNIEIILIDDGSTDESLKICNEFAKKDHRIKVYKGKHEGVAVSRNIGIDNSTGECICFVDSDDIIDSNYVDILITLLHKYNSDIAEADFGLLNQKNKKTKNREHLYTATEMMHRLYEKDGIRTGIITNKLYKKYIFEELRFEKNIVNEDDFIIHKIFFETNGKIATTDLKLYWYRQHKQSRQQTFNKQRIEILKVFDDRKKYFINNKKLLDENEVAQIDMILYLYHLCKAYNYTSEEKILKEQFEDKYKSLNVKINLKKKVKYYMFSRFPNFVAYIISLKQRKYHVR